MTRIQLDQSSSKPAAVKRNLILDSGAFSAWRLGKPVNLDQYCDYILANKWITNYVALDEIRPSDPEEAARRSYENFRYMRNRGLEPIPVFHAGEDITWLFKMLDQKCSYIGLSASSLVSKNQVDEWYEMAWQYLVNRDGLPIVKVHAFGEGRENSLKRFPWYSADTSSALVGTALGGRLILPNRHVVSVRNDGASSMSSPNLRFMEEEDRKSLESILRKYHVRVEAFDKPNRVLETMVSYVGGLIYKEIEDNVRKDTTKFSGGYGFLSNTIPSDKPAVCDKTSFNLHLVPTTNHKAFPILHALRCENILLSYFYIGLSGGTSFADLDLFIQDPDAFATIAETKDRLNWRETLSIIKEFTYA